MDYNKFPINSLIKQAKNFDDYKEFSKFYVLDIYHGYYWHITNNKDFKISDKTGPRDMSSMSDGGISEHGAIMLTSHLEYWDEHYNIDTNTEERTNKRPYAVLFDPSDIEPRFLKQVGRGFGNEVYLSANEARKLKQIGVYSIEQAQRMDEKFHDILPQSEEALKRIYIYAKDKIQNENVFNVKKRKKTTIMNNNLNPLRKIIQNILKESFVDSSGILNKGKVN